MSRIKAAFIHLGLSSTALILLALLTLFYWYPHPFYEYEGVLSILLLITVIDAVLGPVFTLIVFKPGKPKSSLRFDLTIIAVVQIAAFIYGTHTIHSQHPEFVTYVNGVMVTIPASAIDEQKTEVEALKERFHVGPKLAVARLPDDPKVQVAYSVAQLTQGKNLADSPEFYSTFPPEMSDIEKNALDIGKLYQDQDKAQQIDKFLAYNELTKKEVYFLKMVNNLKLSIMVLEKKSGMPVGYLDINPA